MWTRSTVWATLSSYSRGASSYSAKVPGRTGSPEWPEASAMAASPCSFRSVSGSERTASTCARSSGERSSCSSNSCRGRASTVQDVTAFTVMPQVPASAAVSSGSPMWSPPAAEPTTEGSSNAPSVNLSTLPWAMRRSSSAGRPASTRTSPGANSRWVKRSARASSTAVSSNRRSSGSSRSSTGMTRTCDPAVVNSTRPSPSVWDARRFTR